MAKHVAHADYTDAELLALWRAASAEVAATGESYQIRGRMLTRSDAGEIAKMITFFEKRVDAAAHRSATNVFKFVRPQ